MNARRKSKDGLHLAKYDKIERDTQKLPDFPLNEAHIRVLLDGIEKAHGDFTLLSFPELLEEVVDGGKELNRRRKAEFISRHSFLETLIFRPVIPADKSRMTSALAFIPDNSLFLRFMHPIKHFSEEQLDYLSYLDYVDHFAYCVLRYDPARPHATDNGIAVGRYIREYDNPEIAEWAITVLDSHNGNGIGSTLLFLLSEIAFRNGIKKFSAVVHPTNISIINGLRKLHSVPLEKNGSKYHVFDLPVPREFVKDESLKVVAAQAAAGGGNDRFVDEILEELSIL